MDRLVMPILRHACVAIFLLTTSVAWSDDSPSELTLPTELNLTPASVKLAAGETTNAMIVLRNASAATLDSLVIDARPTRGISVEIVAAPINKLTPGSSKSWLATIDKAADAPATGNVVFRGVFTGQAAGETQVSGCAMGMLNIDVEPTTAAGKIEGLPTQLKVSPATIKLAAQEKAKVVVTLLNESDVLLEGLEFSAVASAGYSVSGPPSPPSTLAPGASASWIVEVAKGADAPKTGDIDLLCKYEADQPGSKRVTGFAHASHAIQSREPEQVTAIAEIRVETTLAVLQEHRPAEVFVFVKNVSDYPITLTDLQLFAPYFVKTGKDKQGSGGKQADKDKLNGEDRRSNSEGEKSITKRDAEAGKSSEYELNRLALDITGTTPLLPQQERVIDVLVMATESVPTGEKHTLLIQADLAWEEVGVRRSGSLYAKKEFEVGVLGVSEALEKFGIPTYLFLPGFLFIITIDLLVTYVNKVTFPFKGTTKEFWFFVVVASIGLGGLYYLFSGHNILTGYGVGHIAWSSLLSAASGVVVWAAVAVPMGAVKQFKDSRKEAAERRVRQVEEQAAAELRAKAYTAEDQPLDVLRRLARNGRGFQLRQVNVTLDGGAANGFEIGVPVGEEASRWVSPLIGFQWIGDSDDDLKAALDEALNNYDDPGGLADTMESLRRQGHLAVMWIPSNALNSLTKVAVDAVEVVVGADRLLVEEIDA